MTSLTVSTRAVCLSVFLLPWFDAALTTAIFAQPQAMSVDAIYPAVLQPGTARDVHVIGVNTQDIDQLKINHPGIQAELLMSSPLPFDDVPEKRFGHFRLQVAPDVPIGIYQAVPIGRYGAGNPRPIIVCQEPVELLPALTTDATTELFELKEGVLYVGQTASLGKQRFRIAKSVALATPQLQMIAAAQILDSPALLKLSLKASEQRTIATARTIGMLPAKIAFESLDSSTWSAATDLTLELHDELYRGGQPYFYLLSLARAPIADLWSPGISKPVSSAVAMNLLDLVPVDFSSFAKDDSPVIEVTSPSEVRFPAGRSFLVKMTAPANSPWECQIVSNALGQPTDYRIVAFRALNEGKLDGQFQVIEDSSAIGSKGIGMGHFDPHAIVTIPESTGGSVYLLVQNLQTRVEPEGQIAKLRIAPPQPRFQCVAHLGAWTNNPGQARGSGAYLPRGGAYPIHVLANRMAGFTGPISLRFEGLPEGVTAPTTVMAPFQSEIDILLTASDTVAAWTGPLRIIASGAHGEQTMEQTVPMATVWQNPSAERGPVQSRLCDELWLSVQEDVAPISIFPTQTNVIKVKAGEKVTLPLTVIRRAGGEAKAILRPQNVPPKISLAEWEVAPGAAATEREIVVAADATPGAYTICFLAEMVWKMPLHPESLSRYTEYRDRLLTKLPSFESNPEKPNLEAAIAAANARIETLTKETAPRDYGTHFYTGQFTLVVEP